MIWPPREGEVSNKRKADGRRRSGSKNWSDIKVRDAEQRRRRGREHRSANFKFFVFAKPFCEATHDTSALSQSLELWVSYGYPGAASVACCVRAVAEAPSSSRESPCRLCLAASLMIVAKKYCVLGRKREGLEEGEARTLTGGNPRVRVGMAL